MPSSFTALSVLLATAALLAPAQGASVAAHSEAELRANPIRKVVTMLQDMQKTVESEGQKEEELFEKFMCYCSGGEEKLTAAIDQGKAQISSLTSMIERGSGQKSQLDQDLATHKSDREEAQKTIQESTALREKEAAEFGASSGDMKSNIAAMAGAIDSLNKGLSAALLQTGVGNMLRNIISHSPAVRPSQRSLLLSFLESGSAEAGGSDTIIGVIEQMKDTMEADLAESEKSEADAKAAYETLMTTKKAEIEAAGKFIETKSARAGDIALKVAENKADLEKTTKAVDEDTDFKRNLAGACATKQKEWDARQKLRTQEIQAIGETIDMLSGDDALELFKKTMPPPTALIQTSAATRSQVRRVRSLVDLAMMTDKKHSLKRRLILAALKSGAGGFEKVSSMIDGMNEVLEGEQVDDDKKDVWCLSELDKAKEETKATEVDIGDLASAIEEQKDTIAELSSEIDALKKGLEELDKSVAEATEQRKDEHNEYLEEASSNGAAVDLLGMAKNRLNKFYNPTLYKEPEPVAEEEFFAQIAVLRADPGPAPPTFGEYKKSESGTGVIDMIDQMIKEMKADIAEAKHDEEEAQKDYEETLKDAATKRSEDSKLVVTKESTKSEETMKLEELQESKRTKKDQLDVLEDKIDNLHKACDFLIEQYAAIKEARTKEEEGLKTAKAVLAGANFGTFLQKSA